MNIGIDTMGGDFAPLEALRGIKKYLSGNENNKKTQLTLFGDEAALSRIIAEEKIPTEMLQVVPTTQVIDMHEHPTKALKEKPQSSIAAGFHYLAGGKTDAFISAGNTGAMLVGALFSLKTIEGILRPVISSIIPKQGGRTGLILDVGLNADCKPEQLNQFATLGTVYARHILDISDPKVGLLNVGEEEGKGNLLTQGAYPLLKANNTINFIGNIEGRDTFNEKADVMVCDGFTGNVILKLAESIYDISRTEGLENAYLNRFNFEIYGGTPVLGIEKPVIIGHGISKATAFCNMIYVAEKMLQTDVLQKLKEAVQQS
ncbi:phosphate acyltransferase PlsX [Niabella beijingensis]|uniref:phosphate acyltransferase PlsX n=1 Tax=Niabella beijingensis TaxID=2872700 RepID=UPI001CBD0D47|nr:phosphate acyltransferase PlsX [Niabella beijingensis]MBZ4192341.1 phosphate acyltransferase PlsX [Niabella beijingensis]